MQLRLARLLAFAAVPSLVSPSLRAQATPVGPYPPISPVPVPTLPSVCPNTVVAFVDPITGFDPPAAGVLAQLNDPTQPFRTIQAAIDACQFGVILYYLDPTIPNNLNSRGLVVCMPGLYGPTGVQAGPRDVLPIAIRVRVSVQGSGARRTVLRGSGLANSLVFWPDLPTCGTKDTPREVLVELSHQHHYLPNPYHGSLPWVNTGDSEEMFDAFTLQHGDVQVHFGQEGPALGRISNCIFDLRGGPYFGILLTHIYNAGEPAYWETPFNFLSNTFVMGEVTPEGVTPVLARPDAVAICDVNDPNCGGDADPVSVVLRGVGQPSIQNNLIRSLPGQAFQRELLGIDATDTTVVMLGGTNPGPTNAFHASRTGGTNGTFFSAIVGAPPQPRPSANLDTPANDPPFVGEAIAPSLTSFPAYRDWRLLPSSTTAVNGLQDAGSGPLDDGTLAAVNGTAYGEPACAEFSSFDWDGEAYGNPRRVGEVDIGFDEVHGLIMAGVWANDTNNHNDPDPVIDPNGGQGALRRFMLFPETFVNGSATVNGTLPGYVNLPPIAAWLSQPGTLLPPVNNPALPVSYRDRYIVFSNPSPTPTPWTGTIGPAVLTSPVSGLAFTVGLRVRVDPEGAPPCRYFNAQAAISLLGTTYWTNLQSEYR